MARSTNCLVARRRDEIAQSSFLGPTEGRSANPHVGTATTRTPRSHLLGGSVSSVRRRSHFLSAARHQNLAGVPSLGMGSPDPAPEPGLQPTKAVPPRAVGRPMKPRIGDLRRGVATLAFKRCAEGVREPIAFCKAVSPCMSEIRSRSRRSLGSMALASPRPRHQWICLPVQAFGNADVEAARTRSRRACGRNACDGPPAFEKGFHLIVCHMVSMDRKAQKLPWTSAPDERSLDVFGKSLPLRRQLAAKENRNGRFEIVLTIECLQDERRIVRLALDRVNRGDFDSHASVCVPVQIHVGRCFRPCSGQIGSPRNIPRDDRHPKPRTQKATRRGSGVSPRSFVRDTARDEQHGDDALESGAVERTRSASVPKRSPGHPSALVKANQPGHPIDD